MGLFSRDTDEEGEEEKLSRLLKDRRRANAGGDEDALAETAPAEGSESGASPSPGGPDRVEPPAPTGAALAEDAAKVQEWPDVDNEIDRLFKEARAEVHKAIQATMQSVVDSRHAAAMQERVRRQREIADSLERTWQSFQSAVRVCSEQLNVVQAALGRCRDDLDALRRELDSEQDEGRSSEAAVA